MRSKSNHFQPSMSRSIFCVSRFYVYKVSWSLYKTVIIVFCGLNGKIAAAKFAPFRNLPQIFFNLSFHHFLTQVIFKSDKFPKVSIAPFFYFLIIVLKLPVCFKLLYWKLPSLIQVPAVTLHLNRVLSTFIFTCVTSDVVIYTACCYCYFQFVFAAGVLFPCN